MKNFEDKLVNKIKWEVEHYEPPFNPKDWEKMKERLAQPQMPIGAKTFWYAKWKKYLVLGLVLLMLNGSEQSYTQNIGNELFVPKISSKRMVLPTQSKTPMMSLQNPHIQVSEKAKQQVSTSEIQKFVQPKIETQNVTNPNGLTEKPALVQPDSMVQKPDTTVVTAMANPKSDIKTKLASELKTKSFATENLVLSDSKIADLASYVAGFQTNRFKVAAIVQTFLNQNPASSFTNVGIAGGLMAEMPVRKKWSLGIGFLCSKQSSEIRDDKTFSQSSNLMSRLFSQPILQDANDKISTQIADKTLKYKGLRGDFVVLEMPIQARYHLGSSFVSVGINNQTYLQEDYKIYQNRFEYSKHQYYKPKEMQVGAFSQIDMLASITISGGIETPLSPNTSLQIEPFVKIPTRPVASAAMNLGSLGVSMRMNWH